MYAAASAVNRSLLRRRLNVASLSPAYGRPTLDEAAVPAEAGTHLSAARAQEKWTPAFAGDAFNTIRCHEHLVSCYLRSDQCP